MADKNIIPANDQIRAKGRLEAGQSWLQLTWGRCSRSTMVPDSPASSSGLYSEERSRNEVRLSQRKEKNKSDVFRIEVGVRLGVARPNKYPGLEQIPR